jgi:hypothetical protein
MNSGTNFENWGDAVGASLQNVWNQLLNGLPTFVAALVVLIAGVLIASFLGKLAKKLLEYAQVDSLIGKTGVQDQLGTKISISDFIAWIVKWFFIIATLLAVVNILNIEQVTSFLEQVLLYIPNVIAAVIILALGLIAGNFFNDVVVRATKASGMSDAATSALSAIAKWSIIVFALLAALVQLGIASSLIQILFTGFVAMLALAGGLAFGLGGREKASRWLDKIDRPSQQ